MASYRCESCGKNFDPEKSEICPKCGASIPPSLMTRIERKKTATRMRAEGKMNYDEHCHEDDSWRGSYGAQSHRSAVREHEAELRSNYAAHRPVDHPTRVSNANPAQSQRKKPKSFQQKIEEKPALLLLIFLLPMAFFILSMVLSSLITWINDFAGNFGFQFP